MKQPPEEDCSEEVGEPEEVNGAPSEGEFNWLLSPISYRVKLINVGTGGGEGWGAAGVPSTFHKFVCKMPINSVHSCALLLVRPPCIHVPPHIECFLFHFISLFNFGIYNSNLILI